MLLNSFILSIKKCVLFVLRDGTGFKITLGPHSKTLSCQIAWEAVQVDYKVNSCSEGLEQLFITSPYKLIAHCFIACAEDSGVFNVINSKYMLISAPLFYKSAHH